MTVTLKYSHLKTAVTLVTALLAGAAYAAAGDGAKRPPAPDGVVTPSAVVTTAEGWQIETVTPAGREVAAAMDGRGYPHLSYLKFEKPRGAGEDPKVPYLSTLKYTRWNGAAWELFTVAQAPVLTDGYSEYHAPALALDGNGNPHLAYVVNKHEYEYGRPTPYSVYYTYYDGGGWVSEEVDATGAKVLNDVVLAIGPEGYAALAYTASYPDPDIAQISVLKFARRGPQGWEIEELQREKFLGDPVRLAFGADGRKYIFFSYGLTGEGFACAVEDGGAWALGDVPTGGGDAAFGPDDAGRVYVAYCKDEQPWYASVLTSSLKYAACAGGEWTEETVDDRSDAGRGVALAIDAEGFPYLSYFDSYSLMFAHRVAAGWVRHTLWYYKEEITPSRTALVLDGRGYPVVAFADAVTGELKVARWPGGEWRNPPLAEGPRDLSAAAHAYEWDAYTRAWLAGEPWPATVHESWSCSHIIGALRAEPREDAPEVGNITIDNDDAPVAILDARSVRTPVSLDPVTEGEVYEVWLKVRAGDVVGWNKMEMYEGPALVRFTRPAGPFRTAAAAAAPAIKAEVPKDWGLLTRNPETGGLYNLLMWWNGWACVDGGWIPADTPGMEVYWRTASWSVSPDVLDYKFYFPTGGDVTRIYIAMFEYMGAGKAAAEPALTVITAGGEVAAAVRVASAYYGYEGGTTYYEATLPRPVARDDVLAFTFAVGEGENRVMMKLDPRPAWEGQ